MRGAGLILLLFLLVAAFHYSRWSHPDKEEVPAVMRLQPQLITIVLVDDKGRYSLHQFNDGRELINVIKLTQGGLENNDSLKTLADRPVITGEFVKLVKLEGNYVQVERSWLSARERILLQIPLHPDRMTLSDWEALPGVGPKLAQSIEIDRQKNGNFIEFIELKRVKGIGQKKLREWEEYFLKKKPKIENK